MEQESAITDFANDKTIIGREGVVNLLRMISIDGVTRYVDYYFF
jgi:hypothetical protein